MFRNLVRERTQCTLRISVPKSPLAKKKPQAGGKARKCYFNLNISSTLKECHSKHRKTKNPTILRRPFKDSLEKKTEIKGNVDLRQTCKNNEIF